MSTAGRLTRGAAAVVEDAESLSVRERLIFAQAVFEFGAKEWPKVVDILSNHAFISRPKNFFSIQSCPVIYGHLLKDAELEWSEAADAKKALLNRKLAEKFYRVHMQELRDKITAEESRFKTLVKEIDEIRSGAWDERIRESLDGVKLSAEQPQASEEEQETQEALEVQEPEEAEEAQEVEERQPQDPIPVEAPEPSPKTPEQALEQPEPMEEESTKDVAPDIPQENSEPEPVHVRAESIQPEKSPSPAPVDSDAHPKDIESPMQVVQEPEEKPEENATVDVEMEMDEKQEETVTTPVATRTSARRRKSAASRTPQLVSEQVSSSKHTLREKPTSRSSRKSSIRSPLSEKPEDTSEDKDAMQVEEEMSAVVEEENKVEVEQQPVASTSNSPAEVPEEPKPVVEETRTSTSRTRSPEPRAQSIAKRRASDEEGTPTETTRDKKRPREESEPVDEDEPSTPSAMPERRTEKPTAAERRRFQNVINMLHSQISQHRNGTIFHNPIKPSEAPDYHDIIKRPMDLKTIKARVRDGLINSSLEYQRDIYLMFANSLMYNRPNSDIYRMAEEMMLESEEHINSFRQTEGIARIRI